MVAVDDKSGGGESREKTPQIESKKFESTMEKLQVHMMGVGRCHLGLLAKPDEPDVEGLSEKATTKATDKYDKEVLEWETRRDQAFSLVFKACESETRVKLIRTTYMKECLVATTVPTVTGLMKKLSDTYHKVENYDRTEKILSLAWRN